MTAILVFFLYSSIVLSSNIVGKPLELSQGKCEGLPEQVCPVCGSENLI